MLKEGRKRSAKASNKPAKLSAAKALERNPAMVIATCMVDKKREGSSVNCKSFFAFLFPSSLSFFTFASPTCSTAISAQEKNPLTKINTNKSTTLPSIMLF